jgi:predicted GIY-YIG superfamily endonuclease
MAFNLSDFTSEEPAYVSVKAVPIYSTYILMNRLGRVYVGMTKDLGKRVAQHRAGTCKTSAKMGDTQFRIVHVYAALNYMMSSKLERYMHRIQQERGDKAVLDLVAHSPAFAGSLREQVRRLSPTCTEVNRMKLESCGVCGREVCDCYDRDM